MKRFGFISLIAAGLMVTGLSAGEIQKREVRQQKRIAQGVKSGQLTPGETARLEHKEARLNRKIRDDRQDNGGKLTPKERRQVNHQQNKLSRQIYRDKHDGSHK